MDKSTINLLDLTDSQKAKLLERFHESLNEQIEEAKHVKVVLAVLEKHGIL
jgi:hypothetical protein